MFGKKKDKEKDKANLAPVLSKSKIWGIACLNEDNFDSGFSFLVKSLKWLRKSDAAKLEGIFRKSGDNVQMDKLKQDIDEKDLDFDYADDEDPHNVTGLVKKYLREMKEPILSTENYDAFIAVDNFQDQHLRIGSLKFALSLIPQICHSLMYELCLFLNEVSQHQLENKMTPHNLAIVFAPNILRPKVEHHLTLLTDSGHASAVIETLILNVHEVFFGDPIDIKLENKEKLRKTMTDLYQQQQQEEEKKIEQIKKEQHLTDEDFEKKVVFASNLIRKGKTSVVLDGVINDFSDILEHNENFAKEKDKDKVKDKEKHKKSKSTSSSNTNSPAKDRRRTERSTSVNSTTKISSSKDSSNSNSNPNIEYQSLSTPTTPTTPNISEEKPKDSSRSQSIGANQGQEKRTGGRERVLKRELSNHRGQFGSVVSPPNEKKITGSDELILDNIQQPVINNDPNINANQIISERETKESKGDNVKSEITDTRRQSMTEVEYLMGFSANYFSPVRRKSNHSKQSKVFQNSALSNTKNSNNNTNNINNEVESSPHINENNNPTNISNTKNSNDNEVESKSPHKPKPSPKKQYSLPQLPSLPPRPSTQNSDNPPTTLLNTEVTNQNSNESNSIASTNIDDVVSASTNVDSNNSNKRGVLTRSTSNNELNIKNNSNNNNSENVNNNSPSNGPRERRHTATSRKDVYLYNNNSTTSTITSFSNKPEVSQLKPDISPLILSSSAPSSATSSSPLPRVSRSRKEFNRSISSSEHAGNRRDGSVVGNVGREGSDSFQKIGKLLKLNNSDSTENESNTSFMSTDSPSPSRSNTPESKRAIDTNTTTINNTNNKVEEVSSNLSSSRKHGSEKRVINKLVAENNSKLERRKTDDVSKIGNSESSMRRKAVSVNSDSQSNKISSFVVTTLPTLPTTTITTTPPNNNPTTTISNSNNTNDLTESSSPRIIVERRIRSNSSNTNNLQPLSSSPHLLSSNSPSTSPHSSPRSISPRTVQTKRTVQLNRNSGSSPRSMDGTQ